MTFKNAIKWFEIPAADLDRATTFYETIFQCKLIPMEIGDELRMRMFPTEPGTIGGAICYHSQFYKPSAEGTVVYLNGDPDLQLVLDKIEAAGGKVLMPKTPISDEFGFMALFLDSEGNRVALHSHP